MFEQNELGIPNKLKIISNNVSNQTQGVNNKNKFEVLEQPNESASVEKKESIKYNKFRMNKNTIPTKHSTFYKLYSKKQSK